MLLILAETCVTDRHCRRYCANPHRRLENLCEVLMLSRNFHSQPIDSCILREQRHYRHLFVDTRFCLYQPISSDRSHSLVQSIVALTMPALNFVHLFHSMRLSLRPACTSGVQDGKSRFLSPSFFFIHHFLLVTFAHSCHPRLKKSVPLMFAME